MQRLPTARRAAGGGCPLSAPASLAMGPCWLSSEPRLLRRRVCPEALDDLDPSDPRAVRARGDLQRVHRAMGSLTILRNLIARLRLAATPKAILELGAGGGTLLLRPPPAPAAGGG